METFKYYVIVCMVDAVILLHQLTCQHRVVSLGCRILCTLLVRSAKRLLIGCEAPEPDE